MKRKKSILLIVLLMAVGFAAVSTTLYINGQTKISANDDDFNVYYSDAKVNGVQDKSVITDDTHIVFTTTLETLGEKYVLDYDVTNGSKNYDAELVMECTEGNDYLTVTNEFDDSTNLEALKTRSGKLTLELIKSYAGEEDLEVTITCEIDANAIERDSLGEVSDDNVIINPDQTIKVYKVGDEITLAGEVFNVIEQTDDTITMFAANNIDTNNKQGKVENPMTFSDVNGWGKGGYDLDIQLYNGNVKTYVNNYVAFLKSETGIENIEGTLITTTQLRSLGCTLTDLYKYSGPTDTCKNSEHASWLDSGYEFWTRSTVSSSDTSLMIVSSSFNFYLIDYNNTNINSGVRPVITISKADLESL